MQERERDKLRGDVRGPTRGDPSARLRAGFTDWDNPEDEVEDAPEDYYDDDVDEEYGLSPDDPDYDLSEAAGYSGWEDRGRRTLVPYGVIVAISLLLIFALLLPVLLRLS